MSNSTEANLKKRKKAAAVAEGDDGPHAKKAKKASNSKEKGKEKERIKSKDKGKGRMVEQEAATGEFRVIRASLPLSIPPVFAENLRAGAEEMLDSMVMRYIPALQGVVLAHSNLTFLSTTASVKNDCPFAVCTVGFDATVWSPRVGMSLKGKVNLCSPDHVSLLVHRTFNVSIPRHHIPTDEWEFEYGPAENDPEFGPHAVQEDSMDVDGGEDEKPKENANENEEAETMDAAGKWVHKVTGDKLGGTSGLLEFTVIGVTVANQMLSLIGSIQPDPFSPEHYPETKKKPDSEEPDAADARDSEDDGSSGSEEEDESESEEEGMDTFAKLGRMGDEAAAKEKMQRQAEAEEEAKKGKKKRKTVERGESETEEAGEEKKKKKKKDKKKKS